MGSNPTLSATVRRSVLSALVVSWLLISSTGSEASACDTPYTAKRGDSWWSIAENHGLTLNKVLKINKAKPASKILVGDTVCISNQTGIQNRAPKKFSNEEIVQIIRDEWPDDLEERAIQIAHRESKFNPNAVGIPNRCCFGLFQIYYRWHKGWLPEVGVSNSSQLLDPRLNARAAYKMFQRNSGWGPWE